MKIEDQVCTFEQAEKLFKLGVYFPSFLVWQQVAWDIEPKIGVNVPGVITRYKQYPAYTVAELGVLLPISFVDGGVKCWRCIDFFHVTIGGRDFWGKTEAKARTDALIWLIENNHIKPEELK